MGRRRMGKQTTSSLSHRPSRRDTMISAGAAFLTTSFFPCLAHAGKTATQFIEKLGEESILQLADPDISNRERERRFRVLLEENFDTARISRFVLGHHARNVTPEQMSEITRLYMEVAVLTYAHLFASYAGQGFKVIREVGMPGDRYIMVLTEIQPTDGKAAVKLDWQIRVEGDSYAVVDIQVEGASMAITQREEYTAVLDRSGGDIPDLLAQLRAKVENLRSDRAD